MYWPRGRVWGGSSSLNAMVYIRGHPLDYDNWEDMGAHGWNYQNCLPYFKKAQNHELGEGDYRGGSGRVYENMINKYFEYKSNQNIFRALECIKGNIW